MGHFCFSNDYPNEFSLISLTYYHKNGSVKTQLFSPNKVKAIVYCVKMVPAHDIIFTYHH